MSYTYLFLVAAAICAVGSFSAHHQKLTGPSRLFAVLFTAFIVAAGLVYVDESVNNGNRVSKRSGTSPVISMPFKDPRWSDVKWRLDIVLNALGHKRLFSLSTFIAANQVGYGLLEKQKANVIESSFALSSHEMDRFVNRTIGVIAREFSNVEKTFARSKGLFRRIDRFDASLTFTPRQAFVIIAQSFLGIPLIVGGSVDEESIYKGFTADNSAALNKVKAIVIYLNSMATILNSNQKDFLSRKIVISRISGADQSLSKWMASTRKLSNINVVSGNIDSSSTILQADFANKRVGGGVFRFDTFQEEIRMIISPEAILAKLFTSELTDLEALYIGGTVQFTAYTGYKEKFQISGISQMIASVLAGRMRTITQDDIIAIDAIDFNANRFVAGKRYLSQFDINAILRDANKVRLALNGVIGTRPFGTGDWGGGDFEGDQQLKALIQWIGASEAGRGMVYFADHKFKNQFISIITKMKKAKMTVGELLKILSKVKLPKTAFKVVEESLT